MDRALQGVKATARLTTAVGGAPIVPDSPPTVVVTRDDGTEVANGASTAGDPGVSEFVLTPATTAQLDRLALDWTASIDGTEQTFRTYVEVVGGFLFSLADARSIAPFQDPNKWSDDELARLRTVVEQALEDECNGFAFVPRAAREKVDGNGLDELILSHPNGRAVRSVAIDGAALTADELAAVEATPEGTLLRKGDTWPLGRRNVEVEYEHGLDAAPGRVPGACVKLLRQLAIDHPASDRAISMTNEDGTYQTFVVAGVRRAVFSVPEANAVVRRYRDPVVR